MKKPKGPGKGVRVTNPLVPAPAKHHHRHHKPGKPHHRHHPGHRMTNPLVPGPKPVHLHKAPHHHRHKKPKQPVKRKLPLGEGVACCAAEALAASLRLAGVPVGDEDVLALYWRTAADADAGATISATLEAASEFGLAGVRPRAWREETIRIVEDDGESARRQRRVRVRDLVTGSHPADASLTRPVGAEFGLAVPHGLILGVELPGGPHALTLDPSGAVWSWGELYDLSPDVVIEEAWTVDWSI